MITTSARVEDADIASLLERVEKATGPDNALDIAIEIALFKPNSTFTSVRPNAAGTKLIYTRPDGYEQTFWAYDYTLNAKSKAVALKRLRSLSQGAGHEQ